MIVLDEQLLGRDLLQQQSAPTFVTINERDFWRKVEISDRFCMVCFALPDSRASEIPLRLRSLFHHSEFKTEGGRMGKVIRVSDEEVSYYASDDKTVRTVNLI